METTTPCLHFIMNFLRLLLVANVALCQSADDAFESDKKVGPYFAIRGELERLKNELANDTFVRCGNIRGLNGTLEKLLVGLIRQQHETIVTDAIAYADLLYRKVKNEPLEDGPIFELLRSFLGVNRVLTEIGFIIPRSIDRGLRERFLLRKITRTKTDDGTSPTHEQLISSSKTYNYTDSVYKDWKAVQSYLYTDKRPPRRLAQADKAWLESIKIPGNVFALEKRCPKDVSKHAAEWRMVVVLRTISFGYVRFLMPLENHGHSRCPRFQL